LLWIEAKQALNMKLSVEISGSHNGNMKMAFFWVVAPCNPVEVVPTWHNNPEDSHLHNTFSLIKRNVISIIIMKFAFGFIASFVILTAAKFYFVVFSFWYSSMQN
jgi:hypothetical protein